MSDRANGGYQANYHDDGVDIELIAPVDAAAHPSAFLNGQHGIRYGPAPAGGMLRAAVDRLRQFLSGSRAAGWAGGFAPVSSEDIDPSAIASQGAIPASLSTSCRDTTLLESIAAACMVRWCPHKPVIACSS